MKYRKKPVVVNAIRAFEISKIRDWANSFGLNEFKNWFEFIDQGPDGASLRVKTLEGTSYNVLPTDYLIRGVNGEYYPCKPDIFEKTYEPVQVND
jgi:hypothetical protein